MSVSVARMAGRTAATARLGAILILALGGVAGCGTDHPRTYPVSGVARFSDGGPVRSGYVELIPDAGGPSARGRIDSQGRFVVGTYAAQDGAAAGEYSVLVTQHVQPLSPERARALGPEHAEHAGAPHRVSLRYASRTSTDLRCTVKESENELTLTVDAYEAAPADRESDSQ